MSATASQITSLAIVYSTIYSGADQRKHQISASVAFCGEVTDDRWIHPTIGQWRGKYFHLMTSSWYMYLWYINDLRSGLWNHMPMCLRDNGSLDSDESILWSDGFIDDVALLCMIIIILCQWASAVARITEHLYSLSKSESQWHDAAMYCFS